MKKLALLAALSCVSFASVAAPPTKDTTPTLLAWRGYAAAIVLNNCGIDLPIIGEGLAYKIHNLTIRANWTKNPVKFTVTGLNHSFVGVFDTIYAPGTSDVLMTVFSGTNLDLVIPYQVPTGGLTATQIIVEYTSAGTDCSSTWASMVYEVVPVATTP